MIKKGYCNFLNLPTVQFNWEGGGVVLAGGPEMKIFSKVFRDLGENMVGKQYFQH